MSEKQEDWKQKYEELLTKYEAALKEIDALRRKIEMMKIEKTYEEKGEIDLIIKSYIGDKPKFGGGATLRWKVFKDLLTTLYLEKSGDYQSFIRRFARRQGLTEKRVEKEYVEQLIDDGIIEVFHGDDGLKWRWVWKKGKQGEKKSEEGQEE
jgi:hypothetical protein